MIDNLSLFFAKQLIRKNGNLIRLDGKTLQSNLPRHLKKKFKYGFRFRNWLTKEVQITNGESPYRFRCEKWPEFCRCMTMFIKEPGTLEWIRNVIEKGSVFYDIGANIGIYSILAAERVGESGKVFAFEPDAANFSRLLDNITANNLQNIVTACNFALHEEHRFLPFSYVSDEAGASKSQLCYLAKDAIIENRSGISDIKYAVSIDHLISSASFAPPGYVKIDVDGNELPILRGMTDLLKCSNRPKSIQVEIARGGREPILSFMAHHNYIPITEHLSIYATQKIAKGQNPKNQVSNIIFQPKN